MKRLLSATLLVLLPHTSVAAPRKPGVHEKVTVTAPTRLDWTFAVASQSLAKPPATWKMDDYSSTKQTYDLFVPTRRDPRAPLLVLLFLSPGDEGGGWKAFEKLARDEGVLVASPRGAGNNCPGPRRVRILLDVLDDLRRDYPVDPDQTYLAGFSGGGRIICAVAFAMPELVAGVVPVCAGGYLRDEPYLRQRAVDRLSVALLTGETDFNRGEVERLRGPYLTEVGVRTKVWTQPGLGHAIPGDKVLREAWRWLRSDAPRLKSLAKKYPAARLSAKATTTREALAKDLLAEGKKRLGEKGQLYAGLMQLKGVLDRWPDTSSAKEARKLLEEQEAKPDRSWEKDDIAEQRRFLVALARATTGYGMGPLSAQYEKLRPQMLEKAREYWELIAKDQPDAAIGKEAKKRIAEIEARLKKK